MNRRALLLAAASGLIVSSSLLAQTAKTPPRIGLLLPGTPSNFRGRVDAFRDELKKLGYEDGRNVTLLIRWAENKPAKLPSLAADLVKLQPAVIVTASSAGIAAAKNASATIPIVFGSASQPLEQGFIASFRRPGGNITGVTLHATEGKTVEIAREILPRAQRLAILTHKSDPFSKVAVDAFVPAARRLNFEPLIIEVARAEELSLAFNEILSHKADALYAPPLALFSGHREYLVERSLEGRIPLLTTWEEVTDAGGLLSYGSERNENFRRAAVLVDKILRGANPGELPVEQPQKVKLVVNLKTARIIGLNLPREFVQRADRVVP